jgi:hypothetical protein
MTTLGAVSAGIECVPATFQFDGVDASVATVDAGAPLLALAITPVASGNIGPVTVASRDGGVWVGVSFSPNAVVFADAGITIDAANGSVLVRVAEDGNAAPTVAPRRAFQDIAAVDDGVVAIGQLRPQVVVARFGADGTPMYESTFGGMANETAVAVTANANGAVLAGNTVGDAAVSTFGGTTWVNVGGDDVFVAWVDGDGGVSRARFFGAASDETPVGVSMDPFGNVIVAGTMDGDHVPTQQGPDFGGGALPLYGLCDVFVASLNPDGSHRWSFTLGGAYEDVVGGVATDANGNVYLGLACSGSADGGPCSAKGDLVTSFAADGGLRWTTPVLQDYPLSSGLLVATTSSDVVAVGPCAGITAARDGGLEQCAGGVFVARFDSSSGHELSRTFVPGTYVTITGGYQPHKLAAMDGRVFVSGNFLGELYAPGATLQAAPDASGFSGFVFEVAP